MHSLGLAWEEAAQALAAISREITPATRGVLNSVGGSVADEFASFVRQLQSNVPDMAEASGQLGKLGRNTGVQLEYAKYMILAQLVWLAFEIAQMAFWAPEAIPALITSARLIVRMLLRRLLTSIATGIGMMVGMDAVIQGIQMLKGDRTSWSVQNTISAIESGAIGGAIGGLTFGLGDAFVPKFAGSLIGKGLLGGASGVASTAAMNALFGSGEPSDLGFGGAAGAIGAIAGGGGKRRGGGGDETKVDDFDFHLPDVPDLPDLHGPGKLPEEGMGGGLGDGLGGLGGLEGDRGSGGGSGGSGGFGSGGHGSTGTPAGGSHGTPVRTTGGDHQVSGSTSGVRPPVEPGTNHAPPAEADSHEAAVSSPVSVPAPEVRTNGSPSGVGSHGVGTGGSTSTSASHSAPPITTTNHPAATGDGHVSEPIVHANAPRNAELPGFTTAFPSGNDHAAGGAGDTGARESAAPPPVRGATGGAGTGSAPPVRSGGGQGGSSSGGPSEVAPRAPRPPTSVSTEGGGLGAGAGAGAGAGNGVGGGAQHAGATPPAHQPPAVVAEPGGSGDSHPVLPDAPTQTPGTSPTSTTSLASGGPGRAVAAATRSRTCRRMRRARRRSSRSRRWTPPPRRAGAPVRSTRSPTCPRTRPAR